MANESKFKNLQQDPCDIVIPEEKPIDRVCPTCIPNDSYVPPTWWKETEPWLNEKTCEYSIAVFINQFGESYRLSDLKDIFQPQDDTVIDINDGGVPVPRPATTATFEAQREQETNNKEKFDRIKRSFVKPGIRTMLRHYGKLETDEYVCARKDCRVFTTTEARKYVRVRKHYASLNLDISFQEWGLNEREDIESLPEEIENLNALELFASAADYHFFGTADNIMAVLITVPAHIFDQVPPAPVIAQIDTNIETVRFKISEFTTWISKMEAVFTLFSKYQAYFKHTEEGRLFQLIDGEEAPFYAKFMIGRFEAFETSLATVLETNGYEYHSPLGEIFGSAFSQRRVKEIELKFDKSDESKPFRLTDTITIKPAQCDEVTLKLGPEPNDALLVAGDGVRAIAFRDQTLMAYIANYAKIKTQIDAKTNPPWIDFLVEHTYPGLAVNYGSSMEYKSNAIGCLLDKFEGLDDFILNETMDFFSSLAYQWNKNNCRLLADRDKGKITVFQGANEARKLDKAGKEQSKRQLKESPLFGGFFDKKKGKKKKTNSKAVDEKGFASLLTKMNPCNWKKLVLKGIRCLLSGMTFEEGLTEIIKVSVGSLTTEGMEILLSGLPADKQQKVRETIQKEFKDLPAPWEVGYDPGDVEAAYDRKAQENINQAQQDIQNIDVAAAYEMWLAKKDALEYSKSVGPDYKHYLKVSQKRASEQSQEVAYVEQQIESLKIQIEQKQVEIDEFQKQFDQQQQKVKDAKAKYEAATKALENVPTPKGDGEQVDNVFSLYDAIDAAEKELAEAAKSFEVAFDDKVKLEEQLAATQRLLPSIRQKYAGVLTEEQFVANWETNIINEEAELAALKQKLDAAQEAISKQLQRSPNAIGFSEKTIEEQEEIIAQEKEKVGYATIKQTDKIRQGTYGRAVGNVQKELLLAYGDAIIENASVQEIMNGLERLPGASIIGEFFASFDCPNYSFAYPPISEFLGTFTIGACGKGKTRPFSLPGISRLPGAWDIWDSFYDAFLYAAKKTFTQIISALILKAIQTAEAAICKTLAFAGEAIKDSATAALNGGRFPRSASEIFSDVVCGDQLNDKEKKDSIDQLFSLSGSPQRGTTTPQQVLETMSTLGSEEDYLKAMAGEGDKEFLENVSRTLGIVHPDYENLSTPEGLDQMLQSAGNYLTDEQRERALELAANPEQFFPLDPSICLTNEQAERYYNDLKDVFANQIGDPEIAEEFVNNQRDNARSDLGDLANALANGPEGLLQDEIDKLFADPDPDCALDNSLLKKPEEVKDLELELTKGIFARLQSAFLDDTVHENPFEFTDSVGILLLITADIVGYNYAKHYRVRNNLFFRFFSILGMFDNEAPFPETVGAQMRQKLLDYTPDYGHDSKISILYNNDLTDDDRYFSNMSIQESYPVTVEGEEYHNRNFNYSYSHESFPSSFPTTNFIVENIYTADELQSYRKYFPSMEETLYLSDPLVARNTFRNYVLKNYLQEKLLKIIGNTDLPLEKIADMVSSTNNLLFGNFKNILITSEEGGIPNSFKHGGAGQEMITIEDLTYVDPTPGATEYTHEEDENILGRSLTNNPRVKFLDPLKHGGSYELPNIYIEPDLGAGLLSFVKILIPNIDGCNPKGTNFLQLEELEKQISDKGSKIPRNEKLSESPECVTEIPFDKISSPETLATIEQIVVATIRVYLTHFIINSFSIHGNLALNENNYEELIYEYIASKMEERLSNETSFFASTYEGYTYWLLFLEQCAQIYNRKVKLGEVEPDSEAQKAMDIINSAQIAYTKPVRDQGALFENDFVVNRFDGFPNTIKEFLNLAKTQFDGVYAYPAVGGYLVSQNTRKWDKTIKPAFFATNIGDTPGDIIIMRGGGFRFWTQNQINFAAKIATIAENEETCKVFLKRLIKEQVKFYSDKLAFELNPRPLVYDINKFFLGGSKTFYGNNIRAGIYDVEVPIGGASDIDQGTQSSTEYYGTTNHCAKSDGVHPLVSAGITQEEIQEIKQKGGFYLEKYLRIIPKGEEEEPRSRDVLIPLGARGTQTETQKSKFIIPSNVPSGIQNINEFIEYLNSADIPESANISDWFGNASLNISPTDLEKKSYSGSIGIKFGVRVCYVANENFAPSLEFEDIGKVQEESLKQRTFKLDGINDLITIPLVSYEKDILDEKLASFRQANDNFNQDLKCFVDGLVQSNDFNLIFNKVFNVKKVGSVLACYSDLNFVPSIGLGQDERRDPDLGIFSSLGIEANLPDADDRSDFFNDCRAECRKLFVSNYKRDDFDPPNEEEELTEGTFATQKALAKTYALSAITEEISWLTRRRIKTNKPTDKEGKECQNQFGGLFNIKR